MSLVLEKQLFLLYNLFRLLHHLPTMDFTQMIILFDQYKPQIVTYSWCIYHI